MIVLTGHLFYETVTADEDGETVEGDHGVAVEGDLDDLVSFAGLCGQPAADTLARTATVLDDLEDDEDAITAGLSFLEDVLPADDIDMRDGEMIVYAADVARVDDDEPYLRSGALKGPQRILDAIAEKIR